MLSRRRLRWTVAIIAITACLAWFGVVVIDGVVPVLREPRSAAAAMLQQRIVGLGVGSSTAASAVRAASATAHGANEHEICGVGWIEVDAEGPTAIEAARIVRQSTSRPAGGEWSKLCVPTRASGLEPWPRF